MLGQALAKMWANLIDVGRRVDERDTVACGDRIPGRRDVAPSARCRARCEREPQHRFMGVEQVQLDRALIVDRQYRLVREFDDLGLCLGQFEAGLEFALNGPTSQHRGVTASDLL